MRPLILKDGKIKQGSAVTVEPAPSNAAYEYDALGRVDKIVTPDGDTVIGYNPNGTVETITYPTGRVETYTYDASGNVISMTATGG